MSNPEPFFIEADDILSPGDIVGEGIPLRAEPLRPVSYQSVDQAPVADYQGPARKFEVVCILGVGSYGIVYLVREILYHFWRFEEDPKYPAGYYPSRDYGREYAIKLLFKADFAEEGLTAQLTEATIHQAIPVHPNIVTLHRIWETSAFLLLLLLLEYVPGQDLFYFLKETRSHYEDDSDTVADLALTHTLRTPDLLSSIRPSHLLSHAHLRLIASVFAQMCEAVATCHDAFVFLREIKPESFIVAGRWVSSQDGIRYQVIVKLRDFGLSTHDAIPSDMDCGCALYMSYECRNILAPLYKPCGADIWSLGIVLINMIYHCSPWVDTFMNGFSSFDRYLSNPVGFFMRHFTGMTLPVAGFLVENVFCILGDPTDDSRREHYGSYHCASHDSGGSKSKWRKYWVKGGKGTIPEADPIEASELPSTVSQKLSRMLTKTLFFFRKVDK